MTWLRLSPIGLEIYLTTIRLEHQSTALKVGFVVLTIALVAISGAFYGLEPKDKTDEHGDFTTKGKALVWTSWTLLSVWLIWVMILIAKAKSM